MYCGLRYSSINPNIHRFFITQFFQTCDKCKGNTFKKGRLIVCSGWRRRLKHWGTDVTTRARSPDIPKDFFILGIYIGSIQPAPTKIIIFFSLVRKTTRNAELPAWCITYGSKIGQQNGAYIYFADRIKRNLRRSHLLCTESKVWIFLKIPGTVVDITTVKHLRFNLMLVCNLCWRFRDMKCQEHTSNVNEKQKRMYFELYIKCPSS